MIKLTWLQSFGYVISPGRLIEYPVTFGMPGYPHVTILCVQPHRARSSEELLCTEVWVLIYWVKKLARRALLTTPHVLPVSLKCSILTSCSMDD